MKIVVISASMRGNSQSLKVSNWLDEHLRSTGNDSEVIDLHQIKLPMYDVGETEAPNEELIMKKLANADGVVFVSPEWNGTASHGLINMLQYVGDELAHKPVMLVGVSSGRGGHYPLMQMRNMGYKNNHFVISPESLLVQGVKDTMNDYQTEDSYDDPVEKRADYALKILIEYSKALQEVRNSGIIDSENFPNGV